jgi:hypothetical protein
MSSQRTAVVPRKCRQFRVEAAGLSFFAARRDLIV